jgi:hypothetical protein
MAKAQLMISESAGSMGANIIVCYAKYYSTFFFNSMHIGLIFILKMGFTFVLEVFIVCQLYQEERNVQDLSFLNTNIFLCR